MFCEYTFLGSRYIDFPDKVMWNLRNRKVEIIPFLFHQSHPPPFCRGPPPPTNIKGIASYCFFCDTWHMLTNKILLPKYASWSLNEPTLTPCQTNHSEDNMLLDFYKQREYILKKFVVQEKIWIYATFEIIKDQRA